MLCVQLKPFHFGGSTVVFQKNLTWEIQTTISDSNRCGQGKARQIFLIAKNICCFNHCYVADVTHRIIGTESYKKQFNPEPPLACCRCGFRICESPTKEPFPPLVPFDKTLEAKLLCTDILHILIYNKANDGS